MVTVRLSRLFFTNSIQQEFEGIIVNRSISTKRLKELENKTSVVFENDMKSLPAGLKRIMANDLVSAFESRISALNRAQSNSEFPMLIERGSTC
jgi:hypothetical protein